MATRQDKKMTRGTTQTFRLTFTNSDTGAAIDLTGSTVHFRVKDDVDDANPADIIKSSATPGEIDFLTQSGDTLGQADVTLVPADTSSLTPGNFVYDAWIVLAGGETHASTLVSTLSIRKAVTELP